MNLKIDERFWTMLGLLVLACALWATGREFADWPFAGAVTIFGMITADWLFRPASGSSGTVSIWANTETREVVFRFDRPTRTISITADNAEHLATVLKETAREARGEIQDEPSS